MAKNSESAKDQARNLADAIDDHLGEQAGSDTRATAGGTAGSAGAETGSDDLETLQKKAAERDEYLNLLQRVRADYANYQKRMQKENESTRRFACQPLVADLLPGLDNLERALSAADASASAAGLLDGIRMVHQELLGALERHGVRAIEAINKPFDPDFHEALMEQPDASKPAHTVIQELQKGYSLHDRVIRPARVIVSKAE